MRVETDGKWRSVITPSLRRHIKIAETLKVFARVDGNVVNRLNVLCGTSFKDCPFRLRCPDSRVDYCLAPNVSTEWRVLRKKLSGVNLRTNKVRGCFIYVYNLFGHYTEMQK